MKSEQGTRRNRINGDEPNIQQISTKTNNIRGSGSLVGVPVRRSHTGFSQGGAVNNCQFIFPFDVDGMECLRLHSYGGAAHIGHLVRLLNFMWKNPHTELDEFDHKACAFAMAIDEKELQGFLDDAEMSGAIQLKEDGKTYTCHALVENKEKIERYREQRQMAGRSSAKSRSGNNHLNESSTSGERALNECSNERSTNTRIRTRKRIRTDLASEGGVGETLRAQAETRIVEPPPDPKPEAGYVQLAEFVWGDPIAVDALKASNGPEIIDRAVEKLNGWIGESRGDPVEFPKRKRRGLNFHFTYQNWLGTAVFEEKARSQRAQGPPAKLGLFEQLENIAREGTRK